MPNWKVHLEIAKRLNEKFKYTENQLEEFNLGNILPDINNCFIVKDISKKFKAFDFSLFFPVVGFDPK